MPVAIRAGVSVGLMSAMGRSLAGIERVFDALDHLLEGVRPRAETELGAGNLAGVGRTADRDMGDLGGLEDALDELTAIPFARLREQEAALQVDSSLGWKTDGKVHGCSWSWARRRDRQADADKIRSRPVI